MGAKRWVDMDKSIKQRDKFGRVYRKAYLETV